jgi:hypothetical protein
MTDYDADTFPADGGVLTLRPVHRTEPAEHSVV